MNRQHVATVALALGLSAVPLGAQTPDAGRRNARSAAEAPPLAANEQAAEETRGELLKMLAQYYPPSVQQVLRLDPSLLTNTEYLALYPMLASFLGRHPEVARNPTYFFGGSRGLFVDQVRSPRREALEAMENMVGFLAAFSSFALVVGLTGWGLKTFVEHRRWLRVATIQTDAHSKLLDRLTSNEDLLAYIQSPPGRQFLEAAPFTSPTPRATISAPVNRILWSMQAGIVLALGGAGFWYSRHLVVDDVAQPLAVLGMLLMFLGAGFVISALVAYALSKMLGLFDAPAVLPHA